MMQYFDMIVVMFRILIVSSGHDSVTQYNGWTYCYYDSHNDSLNDCVIVE
jgi:hypothetical protein